MKKNVAKIDLSPIAILKGSLISLAISLVLILFFAFIVKLFGLADDSLKVVNQIIKIISILIGTFIALKKCNKKGLINGLSIGMLYTLFAFVIFSLLNGSFAVDKSILTDVIFGGITGAICGVICVNVKQKSKQSY